MSDLVESESAVHSDDERFAKQWRLLILAVLVLALVLRIVAAVGVERYVNSAGRQFFIEGDANGYWELGQDIAAGNDYAVHQPPRRVLRVPGFPLFLAGVIEVFGDNRLAARCVLAVVGTACCGFTYVLGTRLVMRRVGFWAALMMAVHPWQIGNSVLILSETWFTFWMLLSLLALVRLIDGPRGIPDESRRMDGRVLTRAAVCGALIGISVLIRPGFLPWLVITVAAVLIVMRIRFGARLVVAAAVVVGCCLTMLPWVLRNHRVTGHYVLTSLWSGPSLYDGLNPDADGGSDMTFFDRDNVMARMSEYEMNAYYQQRAVQFARENPVRVVRLAGYKLVRFLQVVPNSISGHWLVWVICAGGGVCFAVLSVLGLRAGLLDATGLLVVVGPFLLFLLVHMVFVGSLRYRLPAEFPLSVLAAVGLRQCLTAKSTDGSGSV